MRRVAARVILLAMLAALAGCATMRKQPELVQAAIAPSQLKSGDTAIVTVQVTQDRHHLVRRIEGIVKDHPEIKFKLHDDGEEPDAKAGDGIWSMQVDVPFQAAPGDYVLELTAYRSDDTPVPVRVSGTTGPLTASIPIIIRNP